MALKGSFPARKKAILKCPVFLADTPHAREELLFVGNCSPSYEAAKFAIACSGGEGHFDEDEFNS